MSSKVGRAASVPTSSLAADQVAKNWQIGDRIKTQVGKKTYCGTVRFVGVTYFAHGDWVGVELEEAIGKNNGTVQEVVYFRCPAQHGLFCRPWTIQAVESVETGTAELKSLTKHLEDLTTKVKEIHAAQAKTSEQLDRLEATDRSPFSQDLIKKVDELHAAQAKNSEKLDLLEVTEQGPFSQDLVKKVERLHERVDQALPAPKPRRDPQAKSLDALSLCFEYANAELTLVAPSWRLHLREVAKMVAYLVQVVNGFQAGTAQERERSGGLDW
ncbi:unnamed protein product [Durusdinium trenchii]|uniref:CAP-Gly domain-containing protein n=1 Tax=Durusdinium trenchii TaxID=1381693 RepID=A0ABP0NRF9_9DINO